MNGLQILYVFEIGVWSFFKLSLCGKIFYLYKILLGFQTRIKSKHKCYRSRGLLGGAQKWYAEKIKSEWFLLFYFRLNKNFLKIWRRHYSICEYKTILKPHNTSGLIRCNRIKSFKITQTPNRLQHICVKLRKLIWIEKMLLKGQHYVME